MGDLRVDADLKDGEPISVDEAVTILLRRLAPYQRTASTVPSRNTATPWSGDPANPPPLPLTARAQMARTIIENMPEELRTKAVLSEGDIRPLLNEYAAYGVDLNDNTVDEAGFRPRDRALAGSFLVAMSMDDTEKIKEQWVAAGLSEEEAELRANESKRDYTDGVIKRPPLIEGTVVLNPETGKLTASPDASAEVSGYSDDFNFDLEAGTAGDGTFMTAEDIAIMLQEDQMDVPTLLGTERDLLQQRAAGGTIAGDPSEVTYRDTGPDTTTPMGPRRAGKQWVDQQNAGKEKYGLSEAVRLPTKFSRQELTTMSKKLEAAGFYDLAGGKPVTLTAQDPYFKKAWQLLVGASLESGKPMVDLLTERADAYQEATDEKLAKSLTDPARIRINTDAVGQSMMGRKLTEQEHNDMVEFVHKLETRNARIAEGLDPDGDPETDEATITADIDARIEEYMRDTNDTEASAKEVSDQYGVFSKLLAGPGRGI